MESGHTIVNYCSPPTKPTTVAQTTAELVLSELGRGGTNGRTSVEQEQPPGMEHLAANLRAIKWTDEKHRLYLKSMEASFVNQLHDSIDILGWSSQNHVSKHNSSWQFKVFLEGWRGKINFGGEVAELNKRDEVEVVQITSNPWIRRYKSECRQHLRKPLSLEKDLEFPVSDFYVRHTKSDKGSSDQFLEVTDQNFIDEENEDEIECGSQSSKRIKTDASSNED